MTVVSYAQNLEDVMLWRALKDVTDGFYVDVGAHDPVIDSVTNLFYQRGWRGINIEPVSSSYRDLVIQRPRDINVMKAVNESPGYVLLYEVEGTGMSTLSTTYAKAHSLKGFNVTEKRAESTTLSLLFEEHVKGEVHFLKIDVEGLEEQVISGANWSKMRPWIVVVESIDPLTGRSRHRRWDKKLSEVGYRFVYFDGLNRFYIASERFDMMSKNFKVPPNVFDDFICNYTPERIVHAGLRGKGIGRIDLEEAITDLYESILARPPDEEGIRNLYSLVLRTGRLKSAIESILLSSEYLAIQNRAN